MNLMNMECESRSKQDPLRLSGPVLTTQFSPRRIGISAAGVGTEMWSADYRTRLPEDDPIRVAAEDSDNLELQGSAESVTGLQHLHRAALEEFIIE